MDSITALAILVVVLLDCWGRADKKVTTPLVCMMLLGASLFVCLTYMVDSGLRYLLN